MSRRNIFLVRGILVVLILFISLAFGGHSPTNEQVKTIHSIINSTIQHMDNKQDTAKQNLKSNLSALRQTELKASALATGKNPALLNTNTIQTVDANGNPEWLTLKCMTIDQTKQCYYVKQVNPNMNVSYSNPPSTGIPTQVYNPGKVSNPWVSIIAGMIYVLLTIYLFILASSNLFKREIFYLVIDMSMWVLLTVAMYVVWTQYL